MLWLQLRHPLDRRWCFYLIGDKIAAVIVLVLFSFEVFLFYFHQQSRHYIAIIYWTNLKNMWQPKPFWKLYFLCATNEGACKTDFDKKPNYKFCKLKFPLIWSKNEEVPKFPLALNNGRWSYQTLISLIFIIRSAIFLSFVLFCGFRTHRHFSVKRFWSPKS